MKWFRENTIGHVVVMGRKTWESLNCVNLPKRINCVVSSDISSIQGNPDVRVAGLDSTTLQSISRKYPHLKIWVIGGGEIYRQTIPFCDFVYLTKFNSKFDCDTFIDPALLSNFVELASVQKTDECSFSVWRRM
jgi:dihydrofolate reductase